MTYLCKSDSCNEGSGEERDLSTLRSGKPETWGWASVSGEHDLFLTDLLQKSRRSFENRRSVSWTGQRSQYRILLGNSPVSHSMVRWETIYTLSAMINRKQFIQKRPQEVPKRTDYPCVAFAAGGWWQAVLQGLQFVDGTHVHENIKKPISKVRKKFDHRCSVPWYEYLRDREA